jgi:ubiquinone/menaquinone biosynthesis C-methylase UbiE
MRRSVDVEELLDGPLDDGRVVVGNLRDLARANRWFGGIRLSALGLAALAPADMPLSVVDVGTGGADIPLALIERARGGRRRLAVTAVDNRPEILEAAALAQPRLSTTADLALRVADGRFLPFADRAFDIAHASLLLHHLEPPAAVELLREMARVARRGVIVNDLVRSRLFWLGAWLLSHLATTNRFTRHDASLSVSRAYTVAELTSLLAAAGLRVEATAFGPFRHRVMLAATPATAESTAGPAAAAGTAATAGMNEGPPA